MSATRKPEETFYDVLKVDPKATIAEIVAAYHTAKNAFSRDSVATYSLFSPEETQGILSKLEEAYLTLSNIEKKRDYDEGLSKRRNEESGVPPAMSEPELKSKAMGLPTPPATSSSTGTPSSTSSTPDSEVVTRISAPVDPNDTAPVPDVITGSVLKEIRERRGLSHDDVSRVTKIPVKFIQAIEGENPKALPARVYLQGFVKNLAVFYKLDPQVTVKSYLEAIDKLQAAG